MKHSFRRQRRRRRRWQQARKTNIEIQMVANEYNLKKIDQMTQTTKKKNKFVALLSLSIASFMTCMQCNVYEMNSRHTNTKKKRFLETNFESFSFLNTLFLFTRTHFSPIPYNHNRYCWWWRQLHSVCVLDMVSTFWWWFFSDVLDSLWSVFFVYFIFSIIYNSNTIFVFYRNDIFLFLILSWNFKENNTHATYRKSCRVVSYWCWCEWI